MMEKMTRREALEMLEKYIDRHRYGPIRATRADAHADLAALRAWWAARPKR